MALPIGIEELLHGEKVEGQRLEFKQGFIPLEVMHTLCAFANDFHNLDGGYLILGVAEDKGRPILPPHGLDFAALDGIQKKIKEIGHTIVPEYHPQIEVCLIEGRYVLQLWAAGGQNRPYQAPKSLGEKGKRTSEYAYFIRRHSSTVEVKRDSVYWNELMELAAKVPFDDRVNHRATVDDLEMELVVKHLEMAGSALLAQVKKSAPLEIFRKMRLVDGPPEFLRPRNAGLMFFNSQPEEFFPGTQINILEFPDGVAGTRIIRKSFTGPISQQLTDALKHLKTQILTEIIVKKKGQERSSKAWNYPYEAIEELLPNAVYHRSYEEREPIEVRVEPERLTITSYPGPDRSIKISDLKRGKLIARRYRNRRVGDLLRQIDLAEEAGTGIPTTIDAMKNNGSPRPDFKTDEERTYFTAILPIHPAFLRGVAGGKIPPRNTPLQTREQQILRLCLTPQSRAEIQGHLNLRDAKHLRQRYLLPLEDEKLLRLTEPANRALRSQKYQTTKKGEDLLQNQRAQRQPTLFEDAA